MRARTRRRQLAVAFVGVGLGITAAGSPALAADRAYELVTPPGSDPRVIIGTGEATPNGNVVCFSSERALPGVPTSGLVNTEIGYCARRTASGWANQWVTGPAVREHRGFQGSQVYWVSPDGARAVFASDAGIYPDYPGAPPGGSTPGTLNGFMWEGGDMPRWLTPTPDPSADDMPGVGEPGYMVKREPVAASEDLRHGIFRSVLNLVPQDTNNLNDVYEWTPDGIRLVSRDSSGAAAGGMVPFGPSAGQKAALSGAISRDGSRIFFHHSGPLDGEGAGGVQNVFMREGDELTLVSLRLGPGPAQDVHFAGASEDGETVYLRSAEQLTSDPIDATEALYRYDTETGEISLAATSPDGIAFLGVSADSSTLVYQTGAFQPELFVKRGGVATSLGFINFLDAFEAFGRVGSPRSDNRALRISPDGNSIVFASAGAFDDSPGDVVQIFRWTPETGVVRVSKRADGEPPSSDGAMMGNYSTPNSTVPRGETYLHNIRNFPNLGRVQADDGRAYFETSEPLVDTDVNGRIDVYEWENGTVRLISPGTQNAHALYYDNSADGNTVFFVTNARIVPELDRNVSADLYAARVGGGFPLPPPDPRCAGDVCQGDTPTPPATPRSGTNTFDGPGDSQDVEAPPVRHSLVKLTAKQRRAFARSGRTVLKVRASARGAVTATGTARIGRRSVRIASSTRAAKAGKTISVPLSLSRAARNELRARRRLRVVISVTHSESDSTVRQVVVLRG